MPDRNHLSEQRQIWLTVSEGIIHGLLPINHWKEPCGAGSTEQGRGRQAAEKQKEERGADICKKLTLRGTRAWARALSLNFSNLHKKSPVGDYAVSTVSLRRIFHNNPHIRSEIWGMETKCHWQGDKYMCLYLSHGQPRFWRKAGM